MSYMYMYHCVYVCPSRPTFTLPYPSKLYDTCTCTCAYRISIYSPCYVNIWNYPATYYTCIIMVIPLCFSNAVNVMPFLMLFFSEERKWFRICCLQSTGTFLIEFCYNSKLLMSYLISATILHIMFCVKIAS